MRNNVNDNIYKQVSTVEEPTKLLLENYPYWRSFYAPLEPIEVVRILGNQRDWYFVLKTDDEYGDKQSFFVAGHSDDGSGDDNRFFGLLVNHRSQEMEWVEFHEREFNEGPGGSLFVVDKEWAGRRSSEVIRGFPGYSFIPEERQFRHPRYPLVTAKILGELKASLRKAPDIDCVALVGQYFDVRMADPFLWLVMHPLGQSGAKERETRSLELARNGQLRIAVPDTSKVPERWLPLALSFDELPDDQRCEMHYVQHMYYVRLRGRILPPSPHRSEE